MSEGADGYLPSMSAEEVDRIARWHARAYERLASQRGEVVFSCLGLEVTVPAGVFPPVDVALLGDVVRDESRAGERVLDMGTGSGVYALLAAQRAASVVAVDVNPAAVDAACRNAAANGVADRVSCVVSDLYDGVDGSFDLIVFNPPFRWFAPRDMIEAATTDEGYLTLRRFMRETPGRLRPGGRVLVHFGTSGDLAYLRSLAAAHAFDEEVVASSELIQDGHTVTYVVLRLTQPDRSALG